MEKLEEKLEEDQKKEEDLKMMQEMYGLLENTDKKEEEQKNATNNMRRDSTTSSVNTQYIDEQIRKYENSDEMQRWKGAFDRTMARKFPQMASRREDGQ